MRLTGITAKKYAQVILKNANGPDEEDLRDFVGEQQNGPPDGEADGTLNEEEWTALRDLSRAQWQVRQALMNARKALGVRVKP